ncbi:MAG: hypothetical protein WDN75_19745 [Bacteroidota bacterium]
MVEAYWLIGKRIIEEEQGGSKRARYGKSLIKVFPGSYKMSSEKGFLREILSRCGYFIVGIQFRRKRLRNWNRSQE